MTRSNDQPEARIVRIVQTCEMFPSQWEGYLADGRAVYVRFRFGRLTVHAHPSYPLGPDAECLVDERDEGDCWRGVMEYDELRDVLFRSHIVTPELMEAGREHIIPALAR